METVFIDRKKTQLKCNQERLYIGGSDDVKGEQSSASSIPLKHLKSVVISCDCALSSGLLRKFAQFNISLICLNNRNINASFMSINETHGNISRRVNQYHLLSCPALRSRFSAIIIKRKLSGQRYVLKTLSNQRNALEGISKLSQSKLLTLQIKLNQEDLTNNEIMGIEGYAAKTYFNVYKQVFNPNLHFDKRTKRPPKDPVNVILSLSYMLLYYEAQRACYGQSLDPMLSILHNTTYGRASLACDLQEALRPLVDLWVWQLFNNRTFRLDHFSSSENGCILNKAGRKNYYQALPDAMTFWRLRLRDHAKILVNIIDSLPHQL